MARKRGCSYGPRRKGRCPSKKAAAGRSKAKHRTGAKKCKFGVNKNTGACLKHPRRKR